MELKDVVRVCTLNSFQETNRYLDIGWKLLYIGQYAGVNCNSEQEAYPLYTVGWIAQDGEPQEPEKSNGNGFPVSNRI